METQSSGEIFTKTIKKEARNAAKAAAKEIYKDEELDFDNDDGEEVELDSGSNFDDTIARLKEEVADGEFDIFDLGKQLFEEANCDVSYCIHKNNQLLCTENNPYSYEQLQEDHGGGSYKVQIKLLNRRNQIFKTQTRLIAEPSRSRKDKEVERESTRANQDMSNLVEQLTQRERETQNRFMKLFEDQKNETKETIRELKDTFAQSMRDNEGKKFDIKEFTPLIAALAPILTPLLQKKDDSAMFNKILEIQTNSQKENQQMMLSILEKTSDAQKTMAEQFSRALEKVGEQINNIQSGSDDKGLDPFKVIAMMKEAESDGFEKFKLIEEMVKEKTGSGDKKDESIVQTFIKTLGPALAGTFIQGQREAAMAPQQHVTQTAPNHAHARAHTPTGKTIPARPTLLGPSVSTQPRGVVRAPTSARPAFNPSKTTGSNGAHQAQNQGSNTGHRTNVVQTRTSSISTPNASVKTADTVVDAGNNAKIDTANSEKIKTAVFEVVFENFMEGKVNREDIPTVGQKCVEKLLEKNIDPKTFAKDFNANLLKALIEENKDYLSEHSELLFELHTYIVELINEVARRVSSQTSANA